MPWADRDRAPAVAAEIEAAGHRITHRWWEKEDPPDSGYPSNVDNEVLTDFAIADYVGVLMADALVVVNSSKSEGKAVETGIALAHNKPVFVVGTRSNIFHYVPSVRPVGSVAEAMEALQ